MTAPVRQSLCLAVMAALAALTSAHASTYEFRHPSQGLATSSAPVSGSSTNTATTPTPVLTPGVLNVSTGELAFDSVVVGQVTASQGVLVSNTGQQAITLQNPAVTGPFTASHNCTATLSGGASCAVNIVFAPVAPGAENGTLTLTSSAGTKSVALTGTATAPSPVMQVVSPATNALNFGNVASGSTVTQVIALKNNGPAYADVLAVSASGLAAPFSVQSNNCTNVAQGASCSVTVAFSPVGATNAQQTLHLSPSAGVPVDFTVTGSATATDPSWSNVAALLSFNGSLTDTTGKTTVALSGGAAISTVAKFGTGSLALNGTSSYATVNSVALGAGAFTVEGWVKTNGTSNNAFIMGFRDPSHSGGVHLTTGGYGSTPAGTFRIGGATGGDIASTTRIDDGAWHYVALTRDSSSTLRIFVDGRLEATGSDTTNYPGYANRPILGVHDYLVNQGYFNGYIDEVRITPGVARYTTTFVVPTAPFPTQ